MITVANRASPQPPTIDRRPDMTSEVNAPLPQTPEPNPTELPVARSSRPTLHLPSADRAASGAAKP